MVRALGLLSGGLDSVLAAKVLQEQGIDITALSFETPFFNAENAKIAAAELKISIIIKDITDEHLEMLLHPRYGYGYNMNPCIDCHILMLKAAGNIMEKEGFDFIFTGEVLGERPMSQNKDALNLVAKESGYREYILRPLSAKLLKETKPEIEGKVERSRLLDISGRQRKRQLELARQYNIKNTPTPAGGCLLTDPGFSKRLKDLLTEKAKPDAEDIELLKTGRHARLDPHNKIIIGRNERDNKFLAGMASKRYILFAPKDVKGPYCMVPREIEEDLFDRAMKICASYCDGKEGQKITFRTIFSDTPREKSALYSKSNRPKELIGSGGNKN